MSFDSTNNLSLVDDLSTEVLFPHVEEALNDYHELRCNESPLSHLLSFKIARQRSSHRSLRNLTNQLLTEGLDVLERTSPKDVEFIQRRFFDKESMTALQSRFHVSEGHIYTLRKRAIERLTDVLSSQEMASRSEQQKRWAGRLSTATYHELFGAESQLQTLVPLVSAPETPNLIIFEGIGGIGKTSLADALVHRLMDAYAFDDFGWVSLKTQQLTPQGLVMPVGSSAAFSTSHGTNASSSDASKGAADEVVRTLLSQFVPDFPLTTSISTEQCLQKLEECFKSTRHFVVIDNLETLAEAQAILPFLERLINPSRFLITSRIRIPSIHATYSHVVPPLSVEDGLRLLRQESIRSNVSTLAEADNNTLASLFDAVGGNPLALRLVVGLAHSQAVPEILSGLQKSPTTKTEELYKYIYQQVWQRLGDLALAVLVYMPIASPLGDAISQIIEGVGLPQADVQTGLDQLIDLNLVNVHRPSERNTGPGHQLISTSSNGEHGNSYRYSIHNLTRTFLLNEAIDW